MTGKLYSPTFMKSSKSKCVNQVQLTVFSILQVILVSVSFPPIAHSLMHNDITQYRLWILT